MMKMIKIIFFCLWLNRFVVHVFSTKSKAGNDFFEVKFKIAEAICVIIRIMKQANQTITENYFRTDNAISYNAIHIIYWELNIM